MLPVMCFIIPKGQLWARKSPYRCFQFWRQTDCFTLFPLSPSTPHSHDSLLTSGFMSHGCRCADSKKIKKKQRRTGQDTKRWNNTGNHISERNNIRGFTPPRLPHSLLPLPEKERQSSTSVSSCSMFELAAPADIFQLLTGGAVAHTHTHTDTDTLERKQTHRNISAHTDLFTQVLRDACLENVCVAGTVCTWERERQGYLAALWIS